MSDEEKREKSIKEELAEEAFEVTINFASGTWHSSKPVSALQVRANLLIFCENMLVDQILSTVDRNYMKRMGMPGKKKMKILQ